MSGSTALTANQLETLFRNAFLEPFNTVLIGGADEPLYLPADELNSHHRLYFREDYISSAFHEIAHWCIAGEVRRQQVDFGYWYQPDGRNDQQQRDFELVEVKPQAVEWHLSEAAGHSFNLSADNLNGGGASDSFAQAVCVQAQAYCRGGLPPRAELLVKLLQRRFGTGNTAQPERYQRACL